MGVKRSVRLAVILVVVAFVLWVGWSLIGPATGKLAGRFLLDVSKQGPAGDVTITGLEGITGTIFSGVERLRVNVESSNGSIEVYLGGNTRVFVAPINHSSFEFELNTSRYADRICGYRLNVVVRSGNDTEIQPTNWFTILNEPKPVKWDKFKHSGSTNLSNVSWPYAGQIELYVPNAGRLVLPEHTVLSGIDLDSAVNFSHAALSINESGFRCWKNRGGRFRVEFEDIYFNKPRLLKFGKACERGCRVLNYSNHKLTAEFFDVGDYAVDEGLTSSLKIFNPSRDESQYRRNQTIPFSAEYLNMQGKPLEGKCLLSVPEFRLSRLMVFSGKKYTLELAFNKTGSFGYYVVCNGSEDTDKNLAYGYFDVY